MVICLRKERIICDGEDTNEGWISWRGKASCHGNECHNAQLHSGSSDTALFSPSSAPASAPPSHPPPPLFLLPLHFPIRVLYFTANLLYRQPKFVSDSTTPNVSTPGNISKRTIFCRGNDVSTCCHLLCSFFGSAKWHTWNDASGTLTHPPNRTKPYF